MTGAQAFWAWVEYIEFPENRGKQGPRFTKECDFGIGIYGNNFHYGSNGPTTATAQIQPLEGIKAAALNSDARRVPGIPCDMYGFTVQRVDLYCSTAGIKMRQLHIVKTPSLDEHVFTEKELQKPGGLAPDVAKVIMEMLYGARLVRCDLLWPMRSIARQISKWTVACDRGFFRLVS